MVAAQAFNNQSAQGQGNEFEGGFVMGIRRQLAVAIAPMNPVAYRSQSRITGFSVGSMIHEEVRYSHEWHLV